MIAITSIMRRLNTERSRENKPEPQEDDKVEAATACEEDERVQVDLHVASCVCLEASLLEEVRAGLIDEGRSLVIVDVDEECPWEDPSTRIEDKAEECVAVRTRLQLKSPIRARRCSIDIITAHLKQ